MSETATEAAAQPPHAQDSPNVVLGPPVPVVKKRSPRRLIIMLVLAVLVVFGGIWGYNKYQYGTWHVGTDDAQVDANISPVLPRLNGYVSSVLVSDNQKVSEGQVLVEIDPREFQLKVETAEAAIRNAEAALQTAQSGLNNAEAAAAVARSTVASANVAREKTQADLARDTKLLKGDAITRQQFDATKAAADAAAAQYATVQRQVDVAEAQVKTAASQVQAAQTTIGQRKADLDLAQLQLSYTKITAPAAGIVSKKSVEVGQFIQAGQPVLAISQDSSVWVTANFKETEVRSLRPGEKVEIEADGYPDIVFHGLVQSISGATGAKFSLLPPDNATGNFVKVTQRVPVKITLTDKPDPQHPLLPGMSVDATVATR